MRTGSPHCPAEGPPRPFPAAPPVTRPAGPRRPPRSPRSSSAPSCPSSWQCGPPRPPWLRQVFTRPSPFGTGCGRNWGRGNRRTRAQALEKRSTAGLGLGPFTQIKPAAAAAAARWLHLHRQHQSSSARSCRRYQPKADRWEGARQARVASVRSRGRLASQAAVFPAKQ